MTRKINFPLISSLLIGLLIINISCRTTEEVVEPEPQDEPEEELEDDMGWATEEEEEEVADYIEELNSIHFDFDRSDIRDRDARLLAENIEMLRDNPDVRVRVDAYTDHVGGDQYNVRLSMRRADSVKSFYTSNGISEDRVETRGLGKHPVPCSDEEADDGAPGCELNRIADSHPLNPSY